ncbi:MAG TPA: diacylglycerol kinase family protein [Myxococcaceae bacterium]|nr:diacylglycerol kinase family protein [Myxococcaceae bacterium]
MTEHPLHPLDVGDHGPSDRTSVGTGRGVAVLFNGRAKQVTHSVVRAMRRALPDALVLVSEDLEQAERHVRSIAEAKPELVISGGGDGAATRLLNLLQPLLPRRAPFPVVGMLRLGTGNAWARAVGTDSYFRAVKRLPHLRWPLPTARFDLVEVEGSLSPFAGFGWDARILNDYQRNLDRRSGQIFGSRFFTRFQTGLAGYLYALFRYTVPSELLELRNGQPEVKVERVSGESLKIVDGEPVPYAETVLYQGPMSVAAAATCPEYGYGIRAFPYAGRVPGSINLRIYDRPVMEALRHSRQLWTGLPSPGMHDFFVKRARVTFSRPMPFQVGGDAHGARRTVEFAVGDRPVQVVNWRAATT